MRVVGCRRDAARRPSDEACGAQRVYSLAELPDFLAACDHVVSVLPSTPATAGLLDGDVLSACARRPVLINVGRGDLLREETVLRALEEGWLSRFVGDVYAPEPLRVGSPLWAHPRVTVTPHNAAVTKAGDVAAAFEENLRRFREGGAGALRHVFDWEAGY